MRTDTTEFECDLCALINRHSLENAANVPDFILAAYLAACLEAFNAGVTQRDRWYNVNPAPGGAR